MRTSNLGATLLGASFGLVVVVEVSLTGLESPPQPIPIAGHVETCAAAAPIVMECLAGWGLKGERGDDGQIHFVGALGGYSAPFARRNFDALITSPGYVTATDPTGRVLLESAEIASASFTVGHWFAVTLELTPTAASRRRLAAVAGPASVPELTWHRDGERLGTSKPGLPAPGDGFVIPVELQQAAVTKPLVNSRVLPCPAALTLVS